MYENKRKKLIALGAERLADTLLERGFSKAYHHGASYLKKLDKLAARIDDWRDFPPHDTYKENLRVQHGRKYRFWPQYEAK